jgi:hypothetical protein
LPARRVACAQACERKPLTAVRDRGRDSAPARAAPRRAGRRRPRRAAAAAAPPPRALPFARARACQRTPPRPQYHKPLTHPRRTHTHTRRRCPAAPPARRAPRR